MADSKPFDNQEESYKANLEDLKKITESDHLSIPERKAAVTRALPKVSGRWNELQSILIDVEVGHRVKMLSQQLPKLSSVPEMIEDLKLEIQDKYKDQPEHKDILLFNVPGRQAAHKWMSRPEWKEEVEKRLKDGNLFSLEKRAALIESLHRKGMAGDGKSAEMWLKMSGDLTSQPQTKDKAVEAFKTLSESLFNGKE
jgi:hypothetical protein